MPQNTNRKHNIHHIPYTNIQHTSTFQGHKTHYLQQRPLHNKDSHRPPPPHSHQNRYKNKHAPYTYSFVSSHAAPRDNKKSCAHFHHTLSAPKRSFFSSLVAPLPNSEQIYHDISNHTYTKSTPNHIHHHHAPFVTLTHITGIISITAPIYVPRCHPWIYGQTPPEYGTAGQVDTEKLAGAPQAG